MGSQQFCLRWNNHQTNLLSVFDQLLQSEAFVDVTIACEGLSVKAHKVVLSACSPYFQNLFLENPCQHPIVILKDINFTELKAIIDFMYKGEVNVSQEQLSAFLQTAETLKVKGLAEVSSDQDSQSKTAKQGPAPNASANPNTAISISETPEVAHLPTSSSSPLPKRKRLKPRRRSRSGSSVSDNSESEEIQRNAIGKSGSVAHDSNIPSATSNLQIENSNPQEIVKMEVTLSASESEDRNLDESGSSMCVKATPTITASLTLDAETENSSSSLRNRDNSTTNSGSCPNSGSMPDVMWSSDQLPHNPVTLSSGIMPPGQASTTYGSTQPSLLPSMPFHQHQYSASNVMPLPPFSAFPPPTSLPSRSPPARLPSPSPAVVDLAYSPEGERNLDGSDENQEKVQLIPPYDLTIYSGQLECCLRMCKGSPTHLLRSLMDIYFSSELLASSSFITLDRNIMAALKGGSRMFMDPDHFVTEPTRRKLYPEERMERAVLAVQSNNMSAKQAAKLFKVPRTTLRRRLKRISTSPNS